MQRKHIQAPVQTIGLVILVIALSLMVRQTFTRDVPSTVSPGNTAPTQQFKIASPVLTDGDTIPPTYSCQSANINPPLLIKDTPTNTKELVLVMRGQDSGTDSNKTHWLAWNIPPDTTAISENTVPEGAIQGTSDFGKVGYQGPCPADNTGKHRFVIELYALNDSIQLDATTTRDKLISAINGKVISKTEFQLSFDSTKGE